MIWRIDSRSINDSLGFDGAHLHKEFLRRGGADLAREGDRDGLDLSRSDDRRFGGERVSGPVDEVGRIPDAVSKARESGRATCV